MAISGNRSPSPNPSSRPNPNTRNSELNSPMRKSFAGNTFQRPSIHTNPLRSSVPATPANSPADFSGKNCIFKEEKENEKDHQALKPAKARTPSVPKGTNHFMIPTISAASKINPSPRKKVLGERNEPLRASDFVQDCDKKTDSKAASVSPFNPNISPKVASIAPLDADPSSIPPYDPKTNYLSPRPQFLHYRPNPRLELYFQEQGSGIKNLEGSFLYDSSSSDTSEGTEPENSHKESDDASSIEVISKEDEPELFENTEVSKEFEQKKSQIEAKDVSPMKSTVNFQKDTVVYFDGDRAEHEVVEAEPTTAQISTNVSNDTEVGEEFKLKKIQNEPEDVSPLKTTDNFQKDTSVSIDGNGAETDVLEAGPITTLISTNVSKDTEISEGSEQEVSKKESKDFFSTKALTENTQNESVDASLFEVVSKEDGELQLSEPKPIVTPISTCVYKGTSKEKKDVKSRFLTRGKFVSLILFLMFACLSVSFIDTPVIISTPVYENWSSSKFYEEGFNDAVRKLKLWSDYSTSYVNELISSLSGENKLGHVQFSNLTYKQEDPFIDTKKGVGIYEQDEAEHVFEDGDESERLIDEIIENDDQNLENEHDLDGERVFDLPKGIEEKSWVEVLEFSHIEATSEVVKDDHLISNIETEPITTVPSFRNTFGFSSEEVANPDTKISEIVGIEGHAHLVSDSETESTPGVSGFGNIFGIVTSQDDPGYNFKTPENIEINDDSPLVSDSEIEPLKVGSDSENTLEIDDESTLDLMPDYKSSEQYTTLAISLLALALVAAPVIIYLKNRKANTPNSTVFGDPIPTKSNTGSQSYSPEDESEMSSFDGSCSYSKGYTWGITNEAHSQEKKQKRGLKRESLASSSGFSLSDSPSYGSFTTYERFPTKHGYGDDEVVTPVRRSSRIKKIQVTSP